jgi:hypothetical protein
METGAYLWLMARLIVYVILALIVAVVEAIFLGTEFFVFVAMLLLGLHLLYVSGVNMKSEMRKRGIDEETWMSHVRRGILYAFLIGCAVLLETSLLDTKYLWVVIALPLLAHHLYAARDTFRF